MPFSLRKDAIPSPEVRGALALNEKNAVLNEFRKLSREDRSDRQSMPKEVNGRKCGRGWQGTKPPGCTRAKSSKASTSAVVRRLQLQLAEAQERQRTIRPGSIGEMSPSDIEVDPARFQYKRLSNNAGEVGSLRGVRSYDPNLAGIVQTWRDPKNGKTFIVNGHNRLGLAKRANAEKIAVRMLDVPSAKAARAVGALSNIAEGRGDSLDSAKFFKDSGITRKDLESRGIPMREKIATDGLAISKLEDTLYRKAMSGEMPVERAAIIGAAELAPEQQRSLSKLIKNKAKRKEITNAVLRELVDTAKSSATKSQVTMTLFGAEEVKQSLAIEKAQLQAGIKRRLSREKKLFGTVGKSSAAQSLSRAGNQINVEGSKDVSQRAAIALADFDRDKNLVGPVSAQINTAARRVGDGESLKKVEAELYKALLSEMRTDGKKKKHQCKSPWHGTRPPGCQRGSKPTKRALAKAKQLLKKDGNTGIPSFSQADKTLDYLGEGIEGTVYSDGKRAIKYLSGKMTPAKQLANIKRAGELGVGPKLLAVDKKQKAIAIELLNDYVAGDGGYEKDGTAKAMPKKFDSPAFRKKVAKNTLRQIKVLHDNGLGFGDISDDNTMIHRKSGDVKFIDQGYTDKATAKERAKYFLVGDGGRPMGKEVADEYAKTLPKSQQRQYKKATKEVKEALDPSPFSKRNANATEEYYQKSLDKVFRILGITGGDRLDAYREDKKLVGIGVKRGRQKMPGKACGKTYISSSYKCKSHYGANGKLNKTGKAALKAQSQRIRKEKGLAPDGGGKGVDYLKSSHSIDSPKWFSGMSNRKKGRLIEDSQDWWNSLSSSEKNAELSNVGHPKSEDTDDLISMSGKTPEKLMQSFAKQKSTNSLDEDRILAGGSLTTAKRKASLARAVQDAGMSRGKFLEFLGVGSKSIAVIEGTKDSGRHPKDPKTGSTVDMLPWVKKHVSDYWDLNNGLSVDAYSGIKDAERKVKMLQPKNLPESGLAGITGKAKAKRSRTSGKASTSAKKMQKLAKKSKQRTKRDPEFSITKNPNGTFSFAGSVPVDMAFIDPTPKKIEAAKIAGERFGPKKRSFKSRAEAVAFAKDNGYSSGKFGDFAGDKTKAGAVLKGKKQTSLFGGNEDVPLYRMADGRSKLLTTQNLNSLSGDEQLKFAQQGIKEARSRGDLGGVREWTKALGEAQKTAFAQTRKRQNTRQKSLLEELGKSEAEYDSTLPLMAALNTSTPAASKTELVRNPNGEGWVSTATRTDQAINNIGALNRSDNFDTSARLRFLIEQCRNDAARKQLAKSRSGKSVKRPGKKCGKTYISPTYKCSSHTGANGKINAEGKAALSDYKRRLKAKFAEAEGTPAAMTTTDWLKANPLNASSNQGQANEWQRKFKSLSREERSAYLKESREARNKKARSARAKKAAATRKQRKEDENSRVAELQRLPEGKALLAAEAETNKYRDPKKKDAFSAGVFTKDFEKAIARQQAAGDIYKVAKARKSPSAKQKLHNSMQPDFSLDEGKAASESWRVKGSNQVVRGNRLSAGEATGIPWRANIYPHKGDDGKGGYTLIGAKLENTNSWDSRRELKLYGTDGNSYRVAFPKGDHAISRRARRLIHEIGEGKTQTGMTLLDMREQIVNGGTGPILKRDYPGLHTEYEHESNKKRSEWQGSRNDSRQRLMRTKAGGKSKRPGKPCGKSYISPSFKCREHFTNGKLNAEGKKAMASYAQKLKEAKGITAKGVAAKGITAKGITAKGVTAKGVADKKKAKSEILSFKPTDPMSAGDVADVRARIRNGEISAKEMKARYAQFDNSRDEIEALTRKRTIKSLQGEFFSWHAKKKDDWVKTAMNAYEDTFLPPSSYDGRVRIITPGLNRDKRSPEQKEKERRAKLKARAEQWTDEELKDIAGKVSAKKAKVKKALNNPETLEEFELRKRSRKPLTEEETLRYEKLKGEKQLIDQDRLAAMKVRAGQREQKVAAKNTTSGASYKLGKHTKTGADLHTVQFGSRVDRETFRSHKATAKGMGGYYSRYTGGFVMPDKATADKFIGLVSPSDNAAKSAKPAKQESPETIVSSRMRDRQQRAATKLRDMARRNLAEAEKEYGQERMINTAKRVADAARVQANADNQRKLAQSMLNVADKLETGDVKFLRKMSTKAQFAELESAIGQMRYYKGQAIAKKEASQSKAKPISKSEVKRYIRGDLFSEHSAYGRQMNKQLTQEAIEKRAQEVERDASREFRRKGRSMTIDDAIYAQLPYTYLRANDAQKLLDDTARGKGLANDRRQIRDQIKSMKSDEGLRLSSQRDIDAISALTNYALKKKPDDYTYQQLKDQNLSRKRLAEAGISTPEILRGALMEYMPLRAGNRKLTEKEVNQKIEARFVGKKPGIDYFPTSAKLSDKVASKAGIRPGSKVLEPSAGTGRLLDAAVRAGARKEDITSIELSSSLGDALKEKGYKPIVGEDFLKFKDGKGTFDTVIMNPPFSNGADMKHVRHAFGFLKEGGTLTAITSEAPFFGDRGGKEAFREFVDTYGSSERLPTGSFKDAGTNVNTRLVTLKKPKTTMADKKAFLAQKGISTTGMDEERILSRYYEIRKDGAPFDDELISQQVLPRFDGRQLVFPKTNGENLSRIRRRLRKDEWKAPSVKSKKTPGLPCGNGWISAKKKCSKAKQQIAKNRLKGDRDVARGYASRVRAAKQINRGSRDNFTQNRLNQRLKKMNSQAGSANDVVPLDRDPVKVAKLRKGKLTTQQLGEKSTQAELKSRNPKSARNKRTRQTLARTEYLKEKWDKERKAEGIEPNPQQSGMKSKNVKSSPQNRNKRLQARAKSLQDKWKKEREAKGVDEIPRQI